MSKAALDAITDKVLAHGTSARHPLKVIAGEPDRPLVIGDVEIACFVLEDETRVLTQRGVFRAFDTRRGGHHRAGAELPRFMASKALAPHITGELRSALTTPILFTSPSGGPVAHGYPATLLPDICDVILQARSAGDLLPRQQGLAERSEILIRGLARVGIIALVDEVTGYQRIREERALAAILEKFLDNELQAWSKTFEFSFYEQIFRLKKWGSIKGVRRPQVIGHYTNDLIYERIAPAVLAELRERNPVMPQGWRKNRHHQWFTPEFGHPKLRMHIEGVTALMRAASSWDSFKRSLERAYPKQGNTIPMEIDKDDK